MSGTVDAMRAGQMVETLIVWHQRNVGALSTMEEQVLRDRLGKEMMRVMAEGQAAGQSECGW